MEKTIGEQTLPTNADNLKEVLFVDHAVFIRALPGAPGTLKIDAHLYDLRTRRRLTRVQKVVPVAEAEKQLATLAATLYLNVSYEAEVETPKDAPPPKPVVRKPFYKTWWFWTVAGVVVAGGVLAGVLVPAPAKSCGGGNFCPGFTF